MKRFLCKIMILCTVCAFMIPGNAFGATAGSSDTITIAFTHDMHSHMEKFAKISTEIKRLKKENKATFLFDAGDFSMGTPYQTISMTDAGELYMMGQVGYDATTLGNHEFDYRSQGLAEMLTSAAEKARAEAVEKYQAETERVWNPKTLRWDPAPVVESELDIRLPELVISNIDWDGTIADKELKSNGLNLQTALEKYGAHASQNDYIVIKRGGARIALFGIFGKEASDYAPESGTLFLDGVETAKATVEAIKKNEKDIDLIVCLSHSGTNASEPDNSEDEILAKEVDGIDLIISGHSHTFLAEPITIGDTVIASCGQYNTNLGEISFKKVDGKYELAGYSLTALDDSIRDNSKTAEQVDEFKKVASRKYFGKYGYKWDQVLAECDVDFTDIDSFGTEQGEDPLGNLIADSYIYGVRQAEGDDYETVDVAVVPAGVVRGSFDKGKITTADVFNVLSLGIGKDRVPGYPLVSVYLTGKELKTVAEIDVSVSEIMSPARLYCSGLTYTYNPHRLFLNRAYDIALQNEKGETVELEDKKLYRVVADLYSAQMLGTVEGMSYGILALEPKDRDGNPIENFEDHIITLKDGSELKEWYALASYIDSFPKNEVPDRYADTLGRKVLDDSKGIISFIKKPNSLVRTLLALVLLVIAVVVLIITLIVRAIRGKNYGRGTVKKKDRIFSRR